ncbi:hypothetical protein Patl1_28084 [Pistacia atlantica]|uniref:Uncharacterized protein n=1 Tax=Pistacia atlantica TaxID=434234 RepID=A0ACC1BBV3_9ROSI|nr:hypothetical protein Patl1_28084 [Pistacia atlantica]
MPCPNPAFCFFLGITFLWFLCEEFFQSPHSSLRKLSLGFVNQYIMLMPSALFTSMDQYLQSLFILANDPNTEVRKLDNIYLKGTGYLLILTYNVMVLEVCAAFVQLIEVRLSFLEVLLSNMVYADDDESLLEAEADFFVQFVFE